MHSGNSQILSPIDSFIMEQRSKILEDRKNLEAKTKFSRQRYENLSPCQDQSLLNNSKIPVSTQNSIIKTPTILVTDYNKENNRAVENLIQNSRSNGRSQTPQSNYMKDTAKPSPKTINEHVVTRDQEKQRFIDYLISSPRDQQETPKTPNRYHTPDLPLPINQRQVEVEKLQNLLSESPSYVPNPHSVNQFNESYIRADSPALLNSGNNTPSSEKLFEDYIRTFEANSSSENEIRHYQPMTITPNTFAHDQSCKKIVKVGEYSPLNPHFQPQHCVLNFGEDTAKRTNASASARHPHSYKSDIPDHSPHTNVVQQNQMPSKKKPAHVVENTSEDRELNVVGTGYSDRNSLPSIQSKIHPEIRYPHKGSQGHVETCGGGDPLAIIKLKQELYKVELDRQIEEKRRSEEERRRREQEEDEKAERAFLEQQERLRREFEMEEEHKLQSVLQQQKREEQLKEKTRQLQLEQEQEKARKREKLEEMRKRRQEIEGRNPWTQSQGNPSSSMLPNPFGNPINSRLDPITSYVKGPPDIHHSSNPRYRISPQPNATFSTTNQPSLSNDHDSRLSHPSSTHHLTQTTTSYNLSPQNNPNRLSPYSTLSYGISPACSRDTSPVHYSRESVVSPIHAPHSVRRDISPHRTPHKREASPIRPPVERFRDISPVRPLKDTLCDSPSLYKEDTEAIINAPQELSMPVKRGRNHNRVTFTVEETPRSPPSTPRAPSPVLPAVKTCSGLKSLPLGSYPVSVDESDDLKCTANRNVLTQLGEFRRKVYFENFKMNERIRQNGSNNNNC